MPIYEFECPKHGTFDAIRSIHGPIPKYAFCKNRVRVSINLPKVNEKCGQKSDRLYSRLGGIIVEGGTGAGRAPRKE